MGSNADLVAYNNALRNIKMHNVPAMASRMAKTILELPRNFMARVDDDGTDHSGEVFDSLWSEIVGHSMACVGGVTLSDCRNTIELVQRLEEHLVKWQRVYVGSVTSIQSAFNTEQSEFISGKWKSLLDKSSGIIRSSIKTTYSDLGFYLDQRNLNDDPGFRVGDYYDTYSLLRDVADTPLQDVISAIVIITTSEDFSSSTLEATLAIKSVVSKALSLYSAMSDLIHGMNKIIEDMKPVMRTGSKSFDYAYEKQSLTQSDVSLFNPEAKDGWQSPGGTSARSWYTAFKVKTPGTFMLSITVVEPYCLDSITVNGIEIDVVNTGSLQYRYNMLTNTYQMMYVYLTDTITLKEGDTVGYTVIDTTEEYAEFDPTKVKFFMSPRGFDSTIQNCDVIENPIKQTTQDTLQIFPMTSDEIVYIVVDSNVALKTGLEIVSASYNDVSLDCRTDEDSSNYNPNYQYHYTIRMPNTSDKYQDTSKPITLYFTSAVSADSVNIFQHTHDNEELNSRENPAIAGIISKEFSGYTDITDYIVEDFRKGDLINPGLPCLASTVRIPVSAIASNAEGKFSVGCATVSPIGECAFYDGDYLTCVGTVVWKDVDQSNGATVTSEIATKVDYTESDVVVTKCTSMVEAESVSDLSVKVQMKNGSELASHGITYEGIKAAVKRGTRFFMTKVGEVDTDVPISLYYTIGTGSSVTMNEWSKFATKCYANGYRPPNPINYIGADNTVKSSDGLVYYVASDKLDGSQGLAIGHGIKYAIPRMGLDIRYPDITYYWNRRTNGQIIRLLKSRSTFGITSGLFSGDLPVEVASYVCSNDRVASGSGLYDLGRHPIIANGQIKAITGIFGNHPDFVWDYNTLPRDSSMSSLQPLSGCMDILDVNNGEWDIILVEPILASDGWKRGATNADGSYQFMDKGYPLAMIYPNLAKVRRKVMLRPKKEYLRVNGVYVTGTGIVRYKLPEPGGVYAITVLLNTTEISESSHRPGIFYSTDETSGDTHSYSPTTAAYDTNEILKRDSLLVDGHAFYKLPLNNLSKDWIRGETTISRIYDLSVAANDPDKPITHLAFIADTTYGNGSANGYTVYDICRLDRAT